MPATGEVLFPKSQKALGFIGKRVTEESELKFAGDGLALQIFVGSFGLEGFVNRSISSVFRLVEDDLFGVAKEEIGGGFVDEVKCRVVLNPLGSVGREWLGEFGSALGDVVGGGFIELRAQTPEAGWCGNDGAGLGVE